MKEIREKVVRLSREPVLGATEKEVFNNLLKLDKWARNFVYSSSWAARASSPNP